MGGEPDGSQTPLQGRDSPWFGLNVDCVMNRSGSRTEAGAGDSEVEGRVKGAGAGRTVLFILPEGVEE